MYGTFHSQENGHPRSPSDIWYSLMEWYLCAGLLAFTGITILILLWVEWLSSALTSLHTLDCWIAKSFNFRFMTWNHNGRWFFFSSLLFIYFCYCSWNNVDIHICYFVMEVKLIHINHLSKNILCNNFGKWILVM